MALKILRANELYEEVSTQALKILVGGHPGAGKTRSASTWPDPLYADVEGRLLSVRDRNVPAVRITAISQLDELRATLAQEPAVREKILGIPVRTVIIDTVDEVARLLEQERLKSEKLDAFRMQDWGWFGDTLRSMLRGFRNLPINVVFNVHLKSDTDGETGRMFEKPQIKGQVGDEIAGYVDVAGLLVSRSVIDPQSGARVPQRLLQLFQDSSHTWLKDHTGALPPEFPINMNDDYERMAKLIFKPTPDAPVSSPIASATMATSDAVVSSTVTPAAPVGKRVRSTPELTDGNGRARGVVEAPLPEKAVEKIPESVPSSGTEPDLLADLGASAPEQPGSTGRPCADCGDLVTNPDQLDISETFYKVPLCRTHFAARKKRKK